jgi:hypothetical protein
VDDVRSCDLLTDDQRAEFGLTGEQASELSTTWSTVAEQLLALAHQRRILVRDHDRRPWHEQAVHPTGERQGEQQ